MGDELGLGEVLGVDDVEAEGAGGGDDIASADPGGCEAEAIINGGALYSGEGVAGDDLGKGGGVVIVEGGEVEDGEAGVVVTFFLKEEEVIMEIHAVDFSGISEVVSLGFVVVNLGVVAGVEDGDGIGGVVDIVGGKCAVAFAAAEVEAHGGEEEAAVVGDGSHRFLGVHPGEDFPLVGGGVFFVKGGVDLVGLAV